MHTWTFFRAGGFDQVRLSTGADLLALEQLDQKLWFALSCPTQGLEFDPRTLESIDLDKDGRIRPPELLAAVKRATAALKSPDDLLKGSAELPLAALDPEKPEGARILASAKTILANLGKPDATVITVEDTADTARIFAQTHFNGDGIITPAAAEDDASVAQIIEEVIASLGSVEDRSGKPGIDQAKLDQFFADCEAFAAWWSESETDETILPLGQDTPAAYAAFEAVRAKIDDWFTRCRLSAFDPRATDAMNRAEGDYVALSGKLLAPTDADLALFPLAQVSPGAALPLGEGLNPAWVGPMVAFRAQAVAPLFGPLEELSAAQWAELKSRLSAFERWSGTAAGASVQPLGIARVREILAGDAHARITALIERDAALAPEAAAIEAVDELVRFHRDLCTLLRNYVSFEHFYARQKALFQCGTLYLDQRAAELCIRVENVDKHAALAGSSLAYIVYCECVRKATGEKMTIAAAITGGDGDNLAVGRNGIFYDRQGRDWDATIVKIIENPISIRQAFWAPYKKFFRFIEDQVGAFASSKDKAVEEMASTASTKVVDTTTAGAEAPASFDIARFAGVFAAIGLALGALGGAMATLVAAFMQLAWWQMPLAIGGLLLVISGPSMLIAGLKLRQRNLGPLLDASGWAVNAHARINIPFGEALTPVAQLPSGAKRSLQDPYAEPRTARQLALAAAVLVALVGGAWYTGLASQVFEAFTPAANPSADALVPDVPIEEPAEP